MQPRRRECKRAVNQSFFHTRETLPAERYLFLRTFDDERSTRYRVNTEGLRMKSNAGKTGSLRGSFAILLSSSFSQTPPSSSARFRSLRVFVSFQVCQPLKRRVISLYVEADFTSKFNLSRQISEFFTFLTFAQVLLVSLKRKNLVR